MSRPERYIISVGDGPQRVSIAIDADMLHRFIESARGSERVDGAYYIGEALGVLVEAWDGGVGA